MSALLQSPLLSPAPIEKAVTSTASRVPLMAFVADRRTEASLRTGLSELFCPHTIIIKRGGIERAIHHLGIERSPENIIIDISGTAMPAARVHELAEVCEPGVKVIAIGDRNDIGLYRDLVQAGVSEYIFKPATPQLLAKALSPQPAPAGRSAIRHKLGKMVAVVGARGGAGTTVLAINLAWYLADRHKRRILLLDLDLENGDCALALNLNPTSGLSEALANPLRIDKVFVERAMAVHSERLFVLSAEWPLRADAEFSAEAVETLVGVLRTLFHYIIVDVPRLPGLPYRRSLEMADVRVIVADQTLTSVRNTVRLLGALGGGNASHRNLLVVNRSRQGGGYLLTLEEMSKIDLHPKIAIPFQPKLLTCSNLARRGRFTKAVAALAMEISGRMPEGTSWWRLTK